MASYAQKSKRTERKDKEKKKTELRAMVFAKNTAQRASQTIRNVKEDLQTVKSAAESATTSQQTANEVSQFHAGRLKNRLCRCRSIFKQSPINMPRTAFSKNLQHYMQKQ